VTSTILQVISPLRLIFFLDRAVLRRKGNRYAIVHPLPNPGIGAARSSARFEIYGAVLHDGEHLHDNRLHDHALLCLQQ